jgi:hypothetical protein
MIEFVVGSEQHTSYWGKFYVKGLEQWEVKEDHEANRRDNHHSYQFLMAEAPSGTLFAVFEQNGNKHGTDEWNYSICVVEPGQQREIDAAYGEGFCHGNYRVVAMASSKIKAPRLMDWWSNRPKDVDQLAYAEHCAVWIEKRGIKDVPRMEAS